MGAGPAGIVTAMFLARQGFAVEVVERRGDPTAREAAEANKGTFVMALIPRDMRPLRNVGGSDSCWEQSTCTASVQMASAKVAQQPDTSAGSSLWAMQQLSAMMCCHTRSDCTTGHSDALSWR